MGESLSPAEPTTEKSSDAATEDADEAAIKKAYKRAALKWHPDRHSNKSEEEQKKMIVRCTLFAHEFRPVTQTF